MFVTWIGKGSENSQKVVVCRKSLTDQGIWSLTTCLADHAFTMTLEYEKKEGDEPSSAAEVLAEMTGRPEEEFRADEFERPSIDELELVPTEEAEE